MAKVFTFVKKNVRSTASSPSASAATEGSKPESHACGSSERSGAGPVILLNYTWKCYSSQMSLNCRFLIFNFPDTSHWFIPIDDAAAATPGPLPDEAGPPTQNIP